MLNTYVVVDVETTGLDATREAIIEVAAIVFQGNDIIDQFSSLVYPRREIPEEITQLTGITQEMVEDAPTMHQVRSSLRPLLSNHILVGHNVDFDLAFLREERLAVGNQRVDTLSLSTILFPEAGRYGLNSLANALYLPLPGGKQSHRALGDAELTLELFLALREKAMAVPLAQLDEIVQAGNRIGWPDTIFFEEVLSERVKNAFTSGETIQRGRLPKLFNPPKLEGRAIIANDELSALDDELITGMIRPGGNFSQIFPGFEYREEQEEMMAAVVQAFNDGDHVLVEAGTGTGKSIGYLLPAAFWAAQNGRRVVISTNTINLQDQLINKDIPEIQRSLPFEIRSAVRKGRSNYLCSRLFQQLRRRGPSSADEMILYARILLWLGTTELADIAELPMRTPGERLAWGRINGDNAVCSMEQCAAERCPVHMVRQRAEQAHIVIVNHALLLSDIANERHVLPYYVDLIIDEAHHLESAVTSGLSFRADKRFLDSVLEEISKPRAGMLADIQKRLGAALPAHVSDEVNAFADKMRSEAGMATIRLDEFFSSLKYFLRDNINARSQFSQQIRLTPAVRVQPDYDEIEISWENLNQHLKVISKDFDKLAGILADLSSQVDSEEDEEMQAALLTNGRDLEKTRENLEQIIANPKDDYIYWVEMFRDRISIHSAPLHVGPLVERHIFSELETVVLTSATLRTSGPGSYGEADFNYIRDRLHAMDTNELAVGSPFDYKNNTLLYLVSDMPEPNQPGYQRYLEGAIVNVAAALGGRTMVLFTAYNQLRQVARAIEGPLAAEGISTLAQLPGSSRQQLLAQFKQPDARAVLLGTRSFWEGVDVPGEALQALLITKLPFDVPSDPIFAARSETFDNSFFEYSIPEAVLRFRQGFGRLIRRKDDEGIVVVLDKRVLTKRYGQMFIDALPECTIVRQRSGRLGEIIQRWMNRERQ